jgi:small nuclear ribonucleoprotein (snRNP)-like protein
MIKRCFSLMLITCLIHLQLATSVTACPTADQDRAIKVKEGIKKIGTGKDTNVTVKTNNKDVVKGYVEEFSEKSFVVRDENSEKSTTIDYSDVKTIKGKNISTGRKMSVGKTITVVGIVVLVAVVVGVAVGVKAATQPSKMGIPGRVDPKVP